MARWGHINFSDFVALRDRLEQLQKIDLDTFCTQVTKEIAQRLEKEVKQKTPRDTGKLARSWTVREIQKQGNVYKIEMIHPLEYTEYVEFGHRKRNNKGWVPGKFMVTITERELQKNLDAILRGKVEQLLFEVF